MKKKGSIALVILDGWGYSKKQKGNAIAQAHPATFTYLWNHYPHALLKASGTAVGLPEGTIGNSEVGHLIIGAGRIIPQSLTRINQALADKSFFTNPILIKNLKTLKRTSSRLHLIGLLSDGNVHSNWQHLTALIQIASEQKIEHIYVHAFLDGRDVTPESAEKYLKQLEPILKRYNAELGSICGRFYAMDRDKNWERTEQAYNMLIGKQQASKLNWKKIIANNYAAHITDEFIPPVLLDPEAAIKNGDGVVCFNFRPDRMRQLTSLLLSLDTFTSACASANTRDVRKEGILNSASAAKNPSEHFECLSSSESADKCIEKLKKIYPLFVITMTRYSDQFSNPVLFPKEQVINTLLDQIQKMGLSIFTIAETEKYAHITYFFNGGRETKRTNETRVLVPSHPDKTYAKNFRMSADTITKKILESLASEPKDFYLINYANADMVGHSGNLASTIKAISCLDEQIKKLYQAFVQEHNGTLILTADHGNAEEMLDKYGLPKTSHTTNPVPFILISKELKDSHKKLKIKELSEIAPFIIHLISHQFAPES